jgi:uncharacterized membrane protein YidH (DUF202 family)
MRAARQAPPSHTDAGLQPERTALAWGRTALAMVAASVLFLRWVPQYGWFAGALTSVALLTAVAIYAGQRVRYQRRVHGISSGAVQADAAAVLWISGSVLALGGLAVYCVLFLPLDRRG